MTPPTLPDSPIGAPIPVRTKADRDETDAVLAALRAEARAAGSTPELSGLAVAGMRAAMRAAVEAQHAAVDDEAA